MGQSKAQRGTVVLRQAVSSDSQAIAAIRINCQSLYLPYASSPHSAAQLLSWVDGHLIPSGGVAVAQAADETVGFMATSRADDCCWIDQMYVKPGWLSQGIGAVLMAHALNTLHRPIRLHTFQENHGARRFYERHGFQAIHFTDGQANEEHCPDVLYERLT